MRKIEKYTGKKTYMFPSGALAAPENIKTSFPAVEAFTHVIETDEAGEVCFAVQNLAAMKSVYNIPVETPDDEAITMIEEIINAPPPEAEPTAEERIAAMLEYQAMLSM